MLARSANTWSRRSILSIGGLGLLGLDVRRVLAAAEGRAATKARAKSVIFLFQWGGPSHLDTFDMKPGAPAEIRGPLSPIATSVPGLQICHQLPAVAPQMHRMTIIRSMTHTMKNHNSAGYYALAGHAPPSDDQRLRDSLDLWPAYGSIIDRFAPNSNGMPTFVSYPHTIRDGSITPGQHASFLGKQHDPLFFKEDPNAANFQLPELSLPANLSVDRLQRRRAMQQLVDQQTRLLESSAEARGFDEYYDKAIGMLTSDRVRKAFDLSAEPAELRDRYGRTTYGQGCLLARRLVESGVKVVTVYFSDSIGGQSTTGGGWDTHGFNNTRMFPIVEKYHFPITNQTLPTLLDDLADRGLLDETLVVWFGEFGRTPKINENVSRDHWPQCYSVLLAGGGTRGGYIYGASDARGAYPDDHPVRPEDLAATIYQLVGIDPQTEVRDRANRPLAIAGRPVLDLFA
ncbi:MAG: DUF1501 domain-containing protein [Planctomycetota bacterium]